jgi:2-polyprenyl-6-methoxyphenol hydroxylase-like FAD-dependent oxidoreductase
VLLGQDHLERILYNVLAKYSCQVELGTELSSFEQRKDRVEVNLLKRGINANAEGTVERVTFDWVIGTDGARGVMRKQLGLSFLGESRNVENLVVGDIHVEGLSCDVSMFHHFSYTSLSHIPIALAHVGGRE